MLRSPSRKAIGLFLLLVAVVADAAKGSDTVTLTFGKIPPGQTSTVVIRGTVIGTPTSISNQATVAGSGMTSVVSDDPAVTGLTNATVISVDPCPAVSLPTLNNGLTGVAYSGVAAAAGGVGPYSYSVAAGTLPTGLSLTTSGTGAGNLTGTPTAVGLFAFTLRALDTGSAGTCVGLRSYSVHVGTPVSAGNLLISEFRLRGPNGAADEYVEIANATASDITISSLDSSGFSVASAASGQVFIIPNGTTIPARGHYLGASVAAGGVGYSLNDYGGTGAATPDASWTADLSDDTGLALFGTSNAAAYSSANRLDSAGFAADLGTLFAEGSSPALPSAGAGPFARNYAFVRRYGYAQGTLQDSGNNGADFVLVAVDPATYGGPTTAMLGAPSPENLSSETERLAGAFTIAYVDPNAGLNAEPYNYHYVPASGTTPKYVELRRVFTNNTGVAMSHVRFKVTSLSTLNGNNNGTQADFRPTTSPTIVTTPAGNALGLTLENVGYTLTITGPTVMGGFNSTLRVGAPGVPLLATSGSNTVVVNLRVHYTTVGKPGFLFVTAEARP